MAATLSSIEISVPAVVDIHIDNDSFFKKISRRKKHFQRGQQNQDTSKHTGVCVPVPWNYTFCNNGICQTGKSGYADLSFTNYPVANGIWNCSRNGKLVSKIWTRLKLV